MKHQVYFGIALRIIILFSVAMAMTYVPDQLRGFFGDTPYPHGNYNQRDMVDEYWEWGVRHYWYNVMIISLFVLSAVNVVVMIRNLIVKHYDTSKWE
jgi:hypothetical protein